RKSRYPSSSSNHRGPRAVPHHRRRCGWVNRDACDAQRRVEGERHAATPRGRVSAEEEQANNLACSGANDADPKRALRARGRLSSASGWRAVRCEVAPALPPERPELRAGLGGCPKIKVAKAIRQLSGGRALRKH